MITILLKMLLYPLSAKQMSSVKAMQKIQPKVKEMQEKFKDKPEKAQKAVMELYKEHKVNPLAGCLPLLVQMPILIAFYQALLHLEYLEPAHAGFLWIANLSTPDRSFILPLLAAASTYWQQKVGTPATGDQTQKYMLMFMPVFIGYIAYTFPAGLALYWVVFSIIGALQQLYINSKKDISSDEIAAVGNVTDIELETKIKTEPKPAKVKKGDRKRNAR
jgi:YidC/Oxa1 family membrane protein insertase